MNARDPKGQIIPEPALDFELELIDACEPPKSVIAEKMTRKKIKLNGKETKIKFEEFKSDPVFCALNYAFNIPEKIA